MSGKLSNHLQQLRRRFKTVRTWQLVLVLLPLLFFTATLLRNDHLKMAELRRVVLDADAAEDDAAIEESLTKLRDFTFSHIVVNLAEENGVQRLTFGTGPFYLEHQYLRAANAAIAAAESQVADDSNPNGNIYAAVGAICRPLAITNGWSWNSQGYLDCWTSELAKYPASDALSFDLAANVPSTELYRHNYASPAWAPTPAGFAILACIILMAVIVVRLLIWCISNIVLLFLERKPANHQRKATK